MPKLIYAEVGQQEEKAIPFAEGLSVGRAKENDLVIPHEGVSRNHAKIVREDSNFFLIDLQSGNGTLINGIPAKPNEKNLLRNHDLITIANAHLRFWMTDERFEKAIEEEVTNTDVLEVKVLKKVLEAVDQETVPSFEVLNGVAEGKKFFLTDDIEEITIGRDLGCDFGIHEYVISRQHAKVVKRWGGIILRDLESKNGSYINNRRILEEYLHDGDRIALGTIVLLFRNPQEINVREIGRELARGQRPRAKPPSASPPKARAGEIKGPTSKDTTEEVVPAEAPSQGEGLSEGGSLPPLGTQPSRSPYPSPFKKEQRWQPMELGMMALGIVVVAFALLTLLNLLMN